MKEFGQVTDIDNRVATVKIRRNANCGSCTACGMGKDQNEKTFTINNDLGATPGDWVELDLDSGSLLKASAIVYLVPLLSLILGVVAGYILARHYFANAELFGALGGILLTALSFTIIRALDPVFSKNGEFSPKMITIVSQPTIGQTLKGENTSDKQ
ncbi:MAG: SoxR reducing system RseC family protein [Clostridiales bacterium]|mgnify:CR=1 FL=1|nr:SoxR reducing system RseC family protein [Clostridiales bacterium]